ncbi:MAG TPA: hypothetical protein PKV71_07980 [Calditrichia bacterium]|nr:hypothetical protein [Calditrichota bacterium]HQU72736.1 hypothetical protein [Calditrichia bacterium]HQV31800.1 hypothetical protein [Calditrichia bacterium]
MAKKEQLFYLIKSLTPAEKRYFRLFNQQNGDSNYLQLFEAIARQTEYDEAAIRRRFKKAPFLRQLHVTKNYLTRQILRSLRNYHGKLSRHAEVHDCLREVEILFLRELFDLCDSEIERGLKLARSYELWTETLQLLGWQRRVLLASGNQQDQEEALNAVGEEERSVLARLTRQAQFWDYSLNVFPRLIASPGGLCDGHPLLGQSHPEDTQQSRILHFYITQTEHYFQRNMPAAAETATRLIAFLEERPELIRENPHAYLTAHNNLIGILLQIRDYPRIGELLTKIRAIFEKYRLSPDQPGSVKLLTHAFNVELEMYRDTGNVEAGIALIETMTGFLARYVHLVSSGYLLMFYYQFAYLHFLAGENEKALHWLNEILGGDLQRGREVIVGYAHLLRLIIHYELRNVMLLKYQVDSCRRFLKKKKRLNSYESALLNFFARLSMAHPEKHHAIFVAFREQLLTEHPLESLKDHLDYLDFLGWIEDKCEELG